MKIQRILRATIVLMAIVMLSACATMDRASNTTKGAAIGAGVGAVAGQVIGHNTEGTLIGAAVGTSLGALVGHEVDYQEAQAQASKVAAQQNAPVNWVNKKTHTEIVAIPQSSTYDPKTHTRCTKVHTKVIKNGKVVEDMVKEECHGEKVSNTY